MISIIIPTYNEKANIPILSRRIRGALNGEAYEVIFVDDSTDDTPAVLAEISGRYPEFRYIHRERETGLATAVIRGFEEAKGEILAVMDADLQHPPELLTEMLASIQRGAELVLPSRFLSGGGDKGLRFHRKVVAKGARLIAQLALKRVRRVTDPMSGFFMLRRHVLHGIEWNPIGWKILIEILVKGQYSSVAEIPYEFQQRQGEQSKMSLREQINYLRHVYRLVRNSPEDRRLFMFLLVGLSGVAVNLFSFGILYSITRFSALWSGFLSSLFAMTSNFLLNDTFTWPGDKLGSAIVRYIKYVLISTVGIGVNLVTLYLLHSRFGVNALASNAIGIAVATGWNFGMNSIWTWREALRHVRI
ncbi:glycosyltransferase [Effusibacillus lacus]|uniref:Dolichyl-phosphate beta-D-mannosyltransferase n=1 Tax=Effusibacillus lacus TaxID=1348429 RepID=A0A292YPN1_9BACL|nr:glycosyltransferase family 2 protein [Effusibacillus lacus]TCS76805.1 dolichol-phosphate mannosyltransferase [Effusibacillus lacus]GAX91136.1 dolichyl-phosphate beta-D-mannosyltransferase [Effusibacillus lacus]